MTRRDGTPDRNLSVLSAKRNVLHLHTEELAKNILDTPALVED
jgi:hypothetical protein